MQSIRQYQRIKAQVRDTCLNGDVARIEQWIDTDSSTPVEEGEKLSSTPISHSHIPGVQLQNAVGNDGQKEHVFIVGWNGDIDPMRPQNWSLTRRWVATLMLCLVSMIVSAASSIDAAVEPQFSKAFHVTDDVGSLTTGKCVSLLFFFFLLFLSFIPVLASLTFSTRLLPLRLRPWVACGRFIFRNLWPQYRVHDNGRYIYDFHHGQSLGPKLWCCSCFSLSHRSLRLNTTDLCWRINCRPLEPSRSNFQPTISDNCFLRWTNAWTRDFGLHG